MNKIIKIVKDVFFDNLIIFISAIIYAVVMSIKTGILCFFLIPFCLFIATCLFYYQEGK